MPKEPETQDRFRITAEVEPTELGPLLAQLARLGFTKIGYELITDVVTFNSRSTDNEAFARSWIAERQTFKLSDLGRHLKDNGRGQSSASYVVGKLVQAGDLHSLGNGFYSNLKAIAAPTSPAQATEATKPPHRNAGKSRPVYEKSGVELIWEHFKNRKRIPFTRTEVKSVFEAAQRPITSLSSCIDKMTTAGLLTKGGKPGEYLAIAGAKLPDSNSYKVSNRDLILNHVKGRDSFTAADIRKLFQKEKRPPTSATSQVAQMVNEGLFERTTLGEYTVVKTPPKANVNGSGEATQHGH